jgi:tRNA(adenine34) deaminase
VRENDPTAHAEIVAIRNAANKIGNYRLDDLTMLVTLEPCGMCAGAILESKISRLIFRSYNIKLGAVGSVYDIIRDQRLMNNVEVHGGILEKQCNKILNEFFTNKRNVTSD